MMKKWIIACLSLMLWVNVQAQKFVVDPLFSDSVRVSAVKKVNSGDYNKIGKSSLLLHNGFEFEAVDFYGHKRHIVFAYGQSLYEINASDVVFSPSNPREMVNPLPKIMERKHSSVGHFFTSYTPYWLIALLVALCVMLSVLGGRKASMRKIAIIGAPLCLVGVIALEVTACYYLGRDVIWWCDSNLWGFWGSLVTTLLFGIVVALQLVSLNLYQFLLLGDQDKHARNNHRKVSHRPVVIGALLIIPVTLLCLVFFRRVLGLHDEFVPFLSASLGVCCMVVGVLAAARRNMRHLGVMTGTMVSIFCVLYMLASLISAWFVIRLIFEMFLQVFIVATIVGGAIYFIATPFGSEATVKKTCQ